MHKNKKIAGIVKHYDKFRFDFNSTLNIYQTDEFNKIWTHCIARDTVQHMLV